MWWQTIHFPQWINKVVSCISEFFEHCTQEATSSTRVLLALNAESSALRSCSSSIAGRSQWVSDLFVTRCTHTAKSSSRILRALHTYSNKLNAYCSSVAHTKQKAQRVFFCCCSFSVAHMQQQAQRVFFERCTHTATSSACILRALLTESNKLSAYFCFVFV